MEQGANWFRRIKPRSIYLSAKHELTDDFVNTVKQAVIADPQLTAQEIIYASDGVASAIAMHCAYFTFNHLAKIANYFIIGR